jgi:tetratricopeptide (TPR) repeat protein
VDCFGEDYAEAIRHFEHALEMDPSFGAARGWLFGAYTNLGEWTKAEELLLIANQYRDRFTPFERHSVDHGQALIKQDHEGALHYLRQMQKLAPRDEFINYLIGRRLVELNRPQESIVHYAKMEHRSWSNPAHAWWRFDNLAVAHHMLGSYKKELEEVRRGRESFPGVMALRSMEVRALAALGRVQQIHDVIDESLSSLPNFGSPGEIMLEAAGELRAHGHRAASMEVAKQSLDWLRDRNEEEAERERHRYVLARTLYVSEKWEEARLIFHELAADYRDNLEYKGYLGTLAVLLDDQNETLKISSELEYMDRPYLFGEHKYWLSCMAAVDGERARAVALLREALAQGQSLFRCTLEHCELHLHCDMNLESLRDDPDFQELIRPKG